MAEPESVDVAIALNAGAIAWRVGVALLLVAANGFFVAAEFALVGARRTRIEGMARSGNRRARLADAAIRRLDHYISGTQLGITLSSLGLGWVGEATIAVLIISAFDGLAAPWNVVATHAVAGVLAFTLITFLHIVLGELAPKSLALLFPEAVSLWTAGPLIVFSRVLGPFIIFLNGTANLLLRAVGLRAPRELERVHRPEELEMLLQQTRAHGLLGDEPAEMIRGVFDLSKTQAIEVMTPRTEIVALAADTPLDRAADFILEEGHSRYPIYEGSLDRIVGVVLARDVWRAQRDGGASLMDIARNVTFVPDTNTVADLLRLMRREQTHFAVVIDEFGGTAGIVTFEDVLEEIVGEIEDELDEARPEPEESAGGEIGLPGRTPIYDVNDRYGLSIPDADYTTVGGFVLGRLGRLAKVGDEVDAPGGRLRVLAVRGRRIDRLALTLVPDDAMPEDGSE
jgi:CBS domain containing-hemolysin-like protein